MDLTVDIGHRKLVTIYHSKNETRDMFDIKIQEKSLSVPDDGTLATTFFSQSTDVVFT